MDTTARRVQPALIIEISVVLVCCVVLGVILLADADRINEFYVLTDMVEYGTGAANFAETGEYFIWFGNLRYPPKYPMGFALFHYPFLKLLGAGPGNLRYGLAFAGVMAVLLTYLITRRLIGRVGGATAAVLLAASPPVALYTAMPMTEAPFTFLLVALIGLGLAVCTMRKLWLRDLSVAGLGALVGLGTALRFNMLIFGLAVAALLIIAGRKNLRRIILDGGFCLIGFLPFAAPLLAYNRAHYGSFTRSGYAYWMSYLHDAPGKVWNSDYAMKGAYTDPETSNAKHALKSAVRLFSPDKFRARWAWAAAVALLVLAGFGLARLFRRRAGPVEGGSKIFNIKPPPGSGIEHVSPIVWLLLLAGAGLLTSFIMLFYYYQDSRFHMVSLPVIFIFAGIGAGELAASWDRWPRRKAVTVILPLAGLFIVAYVFAGVYQAVKISGFEPLQIKTIRGYEKVAGKDAVLISDMYGPYISYWLIAGTGREHVPYNHGRSRQYVMPTKPPKAPRAEYIFALQLLPGEALKPHRDGVYFHEEAAPAAGGRDSLDEAVALGAEPLYRFAASSSPEMIRKYIRAKRPVYMDTVWFHRPVPVKELSEDELDKKKKEIEKTLGVVLTEVSRPAGRPLYRLSFPPE